MGKTRVLYISQEITPYLPENEMSSVGRHLPQGIQETGKEIRTFMPRYGCINERRHQLHEVIRLSGMNLIIDDADHPLIIKVASIQPARMQVYFIDNEEYFQRKATITDENGKFFIDNDERAIFFCRGVLETVKKLGWAPDIVHCNGWMTALVPTYLKKVFGDDPVFDHTQVVYSVFDQPDGQLKNGLAYKAVYDNLTEDDFASIGKPSANNMAKFGMETADAVILGSESYNSDIQQAIDNLDKPVLGYQSKETYVDACSQFYDEILEENSILVE